MDANNKDDKNQRESGELESQFPISRAVTLTRWGGHYVDQRLKHATPKQSQLDLFRKVFDQLEPQLQGKVTEECVSLGVNNLSVSEDKLIGALYSLLKQKSSNTDNDKADDYFMGNAPEVSESNHISFGNKVVRPAAIKLSKGELCRAYLNKQEYSGKDLAELDAAIDSLASRIHLLYYSRKRKISGGKKSNEREELDRIRLPANLIRVIRYDIGLTPEEYARAEGGEEIAGKAFLVIVLHPVLTDQISSKYLLSPSDLHRQIKDASGGYPSGAANTLTMIFLRELSYKRFVYEANIENLPFILGLDKYVKEGRKSLIKTTIEKAINTTLKMGILLNWSIEDGAEGNRKYVFNINPNYIKRPSSRE